MSCKTQQIEIKQDAFDGSQTTVYCFNKQINDRASSLESIRFSWIGRNYNRDSVAANLYLVTRSGSFSFLTDEQVKIRVNNQDFICPTYSVKSDIRTDRSDMSTVTTSTDSTGTTTSTVLSSSTNQWKSDECRVPLPPALVAALTQAQDSIPILFQIYVSGVPVKVKFRESKVKNLRDWAGKVQAGVMGSGLKK